MKSRIIGFAVIVVALITSLVWSRQRHVPLVVSGFIEADEIRLGSRVGGRVLSVHVTEGKSVQKGDILVELDPYDLKEREAVQVAARDRARAEYEKLSQGYRVEEVAQAQARVRQWEARAEKARNGPRPQEIESARAELNVAEANLQLARDNHQRVQKLYSEQATTQQNYDRAVSELKASEAMASARTEQLALLEAGTREEDVRDAEAQLEEARAALELVQKGYREQDVQAAYAGMQEAEAALHAVQSQLRELTVAAPLEGSVEAIELQPGDLIAANAPAISVLDRNSLWVRAYVPEDELDVKIGQQVDVTVDSYPDQTFTGEIIYVSRNAEFTPSNVQTPEERAKQVFRIKVALQNPDDKLRPGMAADVWLENRTK
ncbi:MAG: efflux RND transporter periplasmic adaptor subunit [Planctomycetaceae bacterium]|nr:efflux RND transporter periplasmic adaptor subunit [Planctomycetaceae bacterium]